jgi:hypothetical protein
MRFPDNSLNGDLNDNFAPKISGSVGRIPVSDVNENETVYDLLPVIINRPPVITKSISEASYPPIKPYTAANATGEAMYQFPDGTVKINLGAKVTLRIQAEQPPILNVENGVPTMIKSTQGLTYIWRKDGQMIVSEYRESLASSVTVKGSELVFDNMQPRDAGAYTCEISNDIGSVSSEPIQVEVLNLDFDSYFYRNLIKNPYGLDGTNEWSANNDDLTTKALVKTESPQDFIQPNKVNLFGYTMDMMHPRPYQIEPGVIQDLKMTDTFLKPGASYFTRTRYKFETKGGSFLVRAYQDIDLSDIQWLIRGGVFGVEGVRAFFSCYIGMALPSFIPVRELISLDQRTKDTNYVMSRPRISPQNFLMAGPSQGPNENVSVYFEEYDNETRLTSKLMQEDGSVREQSDRVAFVDPWSKRMWKYWGQQYYKNDIFGLGETSKGDGRDATLFTADELYPDQKTRFTYGQYVEFNKAIIAKLNPQTTKVRITLNFNTTDWRLFEMWRDAYEQGDEILDFVSWESPYERHKWTKPALDWGKLIIPQLVSGDAVKDRLSADQLTTYKNKPIAEKAGAAQDPRGMVTGLNLALLPVLTQHKDATNYYTSITLAPNETPQSNLESGLVVGRDYDPYGLATRKLNLQFGFKTSATPKLTNLGKLVTEHKLELGLSVQNPGQKNSVRLDVDANSLLPFAPNKSVFYEKSQVLKQAASDMTAMSSYIKYNTTNKAAKPGAFNTYKKLALDPLHKDKYVLVDGGERAPLQGDEESKVWNNKVRFELLFSLPSSSVQQTQIFTVTTGAPQPPIYPHLQKYELTVDFSNKSDKKVLLKRTTTMPGQGGGSFELPYEIDPYGKLICTIPDGVVYGPAALGGWGYTANKGDITINDTPINLLKGLKESIISSGVRQEKGKEVLDHVDTIIDKTKASSQAMISGSVTYNQLNTLTAYRTQLESYQKGLVQNINQSLYKGVEEVCKTSIVVKWTDLQGAPKLRNTTEMPSLIGVRPVPYSDTEDLGGSPSYGEDEFGLSYAINYLPIKDSGWGTYN